MSLLNFNSGNKSLKMYTNTLSSISGDHLTIKPYDGQNLLLEVSANNNIFIKKGDVSYNLNNLITGATASDASFSNIDVTINVNPLNNNGGSLGSSNRIWGNAFIRDISVTNISISGNISLSGNIINARQIIPRLTNDISTSLGITSNTWQKAFIRDLSNIVTINGSTWPLRGPTGPRGPTGISGPTGLTGISGSTGAIGTLNTTQRIYQNICGDISWNAVNGYYGIANHAYPRLNPLSSGVKAVQTWTARVSSNETNEWRSVCWSPKLGLFVAVAESGSNRVMTSSNGITWTDRTSSNESNRWWSICWSSERSLFVAVGDTSSNRVMTSPDGTSWTGRTSSNEINNWVSVCWSPELELFVAVARSGTTTNRVMTSPDGTSWTGRTSANESNAWTGVCWSKELRLFVAVAQNGSNRVMTSPNGTTWTGRTSANESNAWQNVCWSNELGLFVAVAQDGSNRVMTSPNGTTWTGRVSSNETCAWFSVCWSSEFSLFVATAISGSNRVMTSPDGTTWTGRLSSNEANTWRSVCWSPELGIFVSVANASTTNRVMTSSLKGRPPTSYNVFDSSFNRIDENGKWDFSSINVTVLTAGGASVSSDDRLKHNEINIANGLDIIDQLNPKFYQKTQVLLDAGYNGDLSNYAWSHEAGLIAQELLQISDLSYVVSGGDYYKQTYTIRNTNYDISNTYYDVSNANYDISYNLIAQPYNVNYNSVFIYGLAAIKELHQKIKTRETSILNRQKIIDNLTSRIQALEANS